MALFHSPSEFIVGRLKGLFSAHKIRFQLLQHLPLLAQVTNYLALLQQHNSILVAYKFCEGSYFFPSQNS
jgi:hypothetical protein